MAMQKSTTLTLVAVIATAVVVMALVSAALVTTRTVSSTGTIKGVGVGVYWNAACTNETQSIDWGTLAPNSTTTNVVYIKNNGTIPVTLSISYSGWSPASASTYLTPGWNCTSYVLGKGLVVAAALTLKVSASITGITDFGYDITITGTE